MNPVRSHRLSGGTGIRTCLLQVSVFAHIPCARMSGTFSDSVLRPLNMSLQKLNRS